MRKIEISEKVWDVIVAHGKFGETANDVLERILKIDKLEPLSTEYPIVMSPPRSTHKVRHPYATIRMSAEVRGNFLHVSFENGAVNKWQLPSPSNKEGIRKVRDLAVNFAKQNGASFGQERAVQKALTNAGYWLTK